LASSSTPAIEDEEVLHGHDPNCRGLAAQPSRASAGRLGADQDQELTSSFCPYGAELQALYQRGAAP
jgi:hypothetical protein